jgi:hypothetical protein
MPQAIRHAAARRRLARFATAMPMFRGWRATPGQLPVCRVTMKGMEVTFLHVEGIPRGNLRVRRSEFAALWRSVEYLAEANPADWYVAGVAATCEWLACSPVPSITGGWELARAPLTRRARMAHEELIAAELMAAEVAAIRNPSGIEGRPGWLEGILATLRWAWSGSSKAPLEVPSASTG